MKSKMIYRMYDAIKKISEKWDAMAQSEDTAIDFAHTNINPEPVRMLDQYKCSYEYYLGHYGESINTRFREDRQDADDREAVEMVASHKNAVPLVLYRGVCEAVFDQMVENAKGMDGVDLYEKAFLATSLVKGHEIQSKCRLRIYVPEGTQCVYLGAVNDEQEFYEVVVQHGARLKIVSMDDTYINCKILGTN